MERDETESEPWLELWDDTPPTVCVRHLRFAPCRRCLADGTGTETGTDTESSWSADPAMVAAVRAYQQTGAATGGTDAEAALNLLAIEFLRQRDALVDQIDQVAGLVGELVPFLLDDVRDGLALGAPPAGHTCPGHTTCGDCAWYERSLAWKARIDAGELSEWVAPGSLGEPGL